MRLNPKPALTRSPNPHNTARTKVRATPRAASSVVVYTCSCFVLRLAMNALARGWAALSNARGEQTPCIRRSSQQCPLPHSSPRCPPMSSRCPTMAAAACPTPTLMQSPHVHVRLSAYTHTTPNPLALPRRRTTRRHMLPGPPPPPGPTTPPRTPMPTCTLTPTSQAMQPCTRPWTMVAAQDPFAAVRAAQNCVGLVGLSLQDGVRRPRRDNGENPQLRLVGAWIPQEAWESLLANALHSQGVHPHLRTTSLSESTCWGPSRRCRSPPPRISSPSPIRKRPCTDTGGTSTNQPTARQMPRCATQHNAANPPVGDVPA